MGLLPGMGFVEASGGCPVLEVLWLTRGWCQSTHSPRVALVGPTAPSCSAQPWSCSMGKGNPKSLRDQLLAAGTHSHCQGLQDTPLPFQPKQRPRQALLGSHQWLFVAWKLGFVTQAGQQWVHSPTSVIPDRWARAGEFF